MLLLPLSPSPLMHRDAGAARMRTHIHRSTALRVWPATRTTQGRIWRARALVCVCVMCVYAPRPSSMTLSQAHARQTRTLETHERSHQVVQESRRWNGRGGSAFLTSARFLLVAWRAWRDLLLLLALLLLLCAQLFSTPAHLRHSSERRCRKSETRNETSEQMYIHHTCAVPASGERVVLNRNGGPPLPAPRRGGRLLLRRETIILTSNALRCEPKIAYLAFERFCAD